MYPENSYKQQAGAGLPIAIFIVTVLSLIVLGMSQLQESSGKAISLQIQSQRAFFAAESGAQVVIAELIAVAGESPILCSADKTITFEEKGLANCIRKRRYVQGSIPQAFSSRTEIHTPNAGLCRMRNSAVYVEPRTMPHPPFETLYSPELPSCGVLIKSVTKHLYRPHSVASKLRTIKIKLVTLCRFPIFSVLLSVT
jgi:MSHA biogenesis protein MshP